MLEIIGYIKTPPIETYEPTEEDWKEYEQFCKEQDERLEAEKYLAWIDYLG